MNEQLRDVWERLQRLGHDVEWEPGSEQILHGQCQRCGGQVTVTVGERYVSVKGNIYVHPCPKITLSED